MLDQYHSSKLKNEKLMWEQLKLDNFKFDIIYYPCNWNTTGDTMLRITVSIYPETETNLKDLHNDVILTKTTSYWLNLDFKGPLPTSFKSCFLLIIVARVSLRHLATGCKVLSGAPTTLIIKSFLPHASFTGLLLPFASDYYCQNIPETKIGEKYSYYFMMNLKRLTSYNEIFWKFISSTTNTWYSFGDYWAQCMASKTTKISSYADSLI